MMVAKTKNASNLNEGELMKAQSINARLNNQTRKCLIAFAGFFMGVASIQAFADDAVTPHIQVLAASCSACHGTQGNSVGGNSVLAGLDRSHFVLQMMAFRNGSRSSTVMHRHAKGLSIDEINDLADYFAAQPRVTAVLPPSQKMESSHD